MDERRAARWIRFACPNCRSPLAAWVSAGWRGDTTIDHCPRCDCVIRVDIDVPEDNPDLILDPSAWGDPEPRQLTLGEVAP